MTDQKYRILYIENANSVGGSIISIYRLVQNLNRQRYEPVILFHRSNGYESRFRELGIKVIVLDKDQVNAAQNKDAPPRDIAASLGRYSSFLANAYRKLKSVYVLGRQTIPKAWRIRQVIKTGGIDLVHLNNRLSDNRSGVLAAWLTRTPCLCHVRDFDRLTWLDRRLAIRVDHFASVSRALEQDMRTFVPTLQGSIVYDGLDLKAFLNAPAQRAASLRGQFELDEDDFVVGNVGRLVPWKGQDVFLKALACAAPQIPSLKAVIVGDPDPPTETGYLQQLLAQTQQLGLSDIVRFVGFQPDVPAVMSLLDVLVHSSSSPEPFGIVVIEGMAAGKPVIATGAGGVLDIVDDGRNGILVPPRDEQAMAEAILTLVRHRDLALQFGTRARQHVVTRFTATQYAQAVETIYRGLLDQNVGSATRSATSTTSQRTT